MHCLCHISADVGGWDAREFLWLFSYLLLWQDFILSPKLEQFEIEY